jgi:hypothetical protein
MIWKDLTDVTSSARELVAGMRPGLFRRAVKGFFFALSVLAIVMIGRHFGLTFQAVFRSALSVATDLFLSFIPKLFLIAIIFIPSVGLGRLGASALNKLLVLKARRQHLCRDIYLYALINPSL